MMTEVRAARIRDELHRRIAMLAEGRGQYSPRQLVEAVDSIRAFAADSGFSAVSCIAAKLESALARDIAGPTLLCYLDAIDDAVKLEPMRHTAQQSLLASVALRVGM